MKPEKNWYLVFNSNKARILRNLGGYGIPPAPELVLQTRHHRLRDHLADRPARSFWSGHQGRSADVMPSSDPVRAETFEFCKDVASFLTAALAEERADGLFIVAPPEMLGLWREAETPNIRAATRAEYPLNLMRLAPAALVRRLAKLPPPEAGTA